MTSISAFLALAAFPVLGWLTPEPVSLQWGFRHGKLGVPAPPLPPGLKERSERNSRCLRLLRYAVLSGFLFFLMRASSLQTSVVGLTLHHWPRFLLLGSGAGLVWVASTSFIGGIGGHSWRRGPRQLEDYFASGSLELWIFITLVGCFVEEYWRAFCLVGFEQVGYTPLFALLVTSFVFALAHYGGGARALEFGRLSGHATFGVLVALLFIWSHSIVATYSAHAVGNLIALCWARRAASG